MIHDDDDDDDDDEILSCMVFQYLMFRCDIKLWPRFQLISLTIPTKNIHSISSAETTERWHKIPDPENHHSTIPKN